VVIEHFQRFVWFLRYLVRYTAIVWMSLLALVILIILGGVAISWAEGIGIDDGIYFAFITGLTIGYGDITPHTIAGRFVSVAIGFVGLLFVGLVVAIATHALKDSTTHGNRRK
jgi:hypothetical protein